MPLLRLPLLPLCLAALVPGMAAVAIFAVLHGDWESLQSFLACAVLTGFVAAILAVAMAPGRRAGTAASELRELVACWALVPVFAAVPLWLRTPFVGFGGAWFEMLCAFTTTGGSVYAEPGTIPPAVHLWRGIMGWSGGLLTLTAAFVILAPRNLGGTETSLQADGLPGATGGAPMLGGSAITDIEDRLARALQRVLPAYAGLTAILALLFSAVGLDGLSASVHAMSILSTSGISPHSQGLAGAGSLPAEAIAALFLVLSSTRLTYYPSRRMGLIRRWLRDPEILLLLLLISVATLALFLRHWFGALTADAAEPTPDALRALWGAAFTSLSFATTTGFESAFWQSARGWSGLDSPALLLLGLCAIGGGAATTAGGIKLIRLYALLRHGYFELERIAQPNSVLAAGNRLRGILRVGAFYAWAFVMLYAAAIFCALVALTVVGMSFEDALIASISALSNTGPAFDAVAPGNIDYPRLSESQRLILGLLMILGRLEMLAAISLFGSAAWGILSIRTKNAGNAGRKVAKSGR